MSNEQERRVLIILEATNELLAWLHDGEDVSEFTFVLDGVEYNSKFLEDNASLLLQRIKLHKENKTT